jgi:hypothetical protein
VAAGSPFGEATRLNVLAEYLAQAGRPVTIENAWEHVYRLLLSIDQRTGLAHVYDANHMQPGGTFHGRAVRFTQLLCKRWGISRAHLPSQIDFMFRRCVEVYLAQKDAAVARTAARAIKAAAIARPEEEEEEAASEFIVEVTELLVKQLGIAPSTRLDEVIAQIKKRADHHYTIGRKRQNVRGEGFEDVLAHLLVNVASVQKSQVLVRKPATALPGFRKAIDASKKDKVPKADLAIVSPDTRITHWWLTVKWSLRQDRLDVFGQEFSYFQGNKRQKESVDYVLITNELDIARLRAVLAPPPGAGGFHLDRVYHVNRELLAETHAEKHEESFDSLSVYVAEGRLLSLVDLLQHAKGEFAPSTR